MYHNPKAKTYKYDTFTNDASLFNEGKMIKGLERRKNVGFVKDGQRETTKGVSQYDYFSKNGKRVTILGYLQQIGNIFDIFSVLSYASLSDEEFLNTPLKVGGVLSPVFDIAGVLMQEVKAEYDEYLTEALQKDLDAAKCEGLDAVRDLIEIDTVNKFLNYDIFEVKRTTALEMIKNRFLNLDEMLKFDKKVNPNDESVHLLTKYKEINLDKTKKYFINIIEAIYYDATI